jgi:pre-mRNA-splicing factor ATP-dependent RNA helicase DHX16
VTDQEQWEQSQIKSSKTGKTVDEGLDYEYVFDEAQQIEFVKIEKAKAEKEALEPPKPSESERKKVSMKEIRESLPVYQYRQALLDAIAQHPVVIIVGETGSGKVYPLY